MFAKGKGLLDRFEFWPLATNRVRTGACRELAIRVQLERLTVHRPLRLAQCARAEVHLHLNARHSPSVRREDDDEQDDHTENRGATDTKHQR